MKVKLKRLRDQVIVITGASSGIGLTTAELAARAGACVVLNARDEDALAEARDRITAQGGHALAVAGDVASPEAMETLASRAVTEFGRIDTWVNNAGIGMYGRLTEMSLEEKRRLFDVNFWGVVHGCRAAVRQLRSRGGAIINIGSVASDRTIPLLGIYSASKHAVKAYTDALRMELEERRVPIAVTLVKPASINTPFTDHARSHMEAAPEYVSPVYPPEEVARAILRCAEHPTRDIIVGGGGKVMSMMEKVAPRLTDLAMERTLFAGQKKATRRAGADSFDEPQGNGHRYGETDRHVMRTSAYTRAALSDVGRALPVLALGALVATAMASRRRA